MKSPSFYEEQLEAKGFCLPGPLSLFGKGFWLLIPFAIGGCYGFAKLMQTFSGDAFGAQKQLSILTIIFFVGCAIAFVLDRPFNGKKFQGRLIKALIALIPTFIFAFIVRHYYFNGFPMHPYAEGHLKVFYKVSEAAVYSFLVMGIGLILGIRLLDFILRDMREDAGANRHQYGWAQKQLDKYKKRIQELLEYDEEVQLTLTESVSAPERAEATVLLMLGLYLSLMLIVTVSALSATGENLIITVNLLFVPLIMATFLCFPKVRNQHRFVAIPLYVAFLIALACAEVLTPMELFIAALTTIIAIPVFYLIYLDILHWLRRRFLVVTNKRVAILSPKKTDERALIEIDIEKTPMVFEDSDYTLVKMSSTKETKPIEFCISTHPEVDKLKEVTNDKFSVLGKERKAPFVGWRATPIVLALVLAICWQFYSVIYLGLGLGLTTIVSIADWSNGRAEEMYHNHTVMTRYFPCSATVHWFRALTAADTERYVEAIDAHDNTRQLNFGGGSIGKFLLQAKHYNFVRFCCHALGLQEEVDKLPVPRGVNVGAFREMEYARRYAKIVKGLDGVVLARYRVVFSHLRRAVDYAGGSYPQARLELAEALVGTGIYDLGKCAYREVAWDLEARKLLKSVHANVNRDQYERVLNMLDKRDKERAEAKAKAKAEARAKAMKK